MLLLNEQDEEINLLEFISYFDKMLPPSEADGVFLGRILTKKENGIVIQLSFIYYGNSYENSLTITISKDEKIISETYFTECNWIKIVDKKDKVFEINCLSFSQPSKTILSLKGEPILKFFDTCDES